MHTFVFWVTHSLRMPCSLTQLGYPIYKVKSIIHCGHTLTDCYLESFPVPSNPRTLSFFHLSVTAALFSSSTRTLTIPDHVYLSFQDLEWFNLLSTWISTVVLINHSYLPLPDIPALSQVLKIILLISPRNVEMLPVQNKLHPAIEFYLRMPWMSACYETGAGAEASADQCLYFQTAVKTQKTRSMLDKVI